MLICGLVGYINMRNLFQWASLLRIYSDWRVAEDTSLVTKLKLTLWDLEKKKPNLFETIVKKKKRKKEEVEKNFNTLTPHPWIHKGRPKRLGYRKKKLKRLPKREFLYGAICTVITLLRCWYANSSNNVPLLQNRLFLIANAWGEIFRYKF